jgi:hypothetical protein
MVIEWLAAFADVPESSLGAAVRFWSAVTASAALAPHGDDDELVPLAAEGEDPYLWVQKVHRGAGEGGWHLDAFVDDLDEATAVARTLGASVTRARPDLVTLSSPAGQPFCLVTHEDENRPAGPRRWPGDYHSLLDQICLDMPSAVYDGESRFWSALTGWEIRHGNLPEFDHLIRPPQVPLRILLQRLGHADNGPVRAHADFACDDIGKERRRHEELGAVTVRTAERWTTLRDPAGLEYCITGRNPLTARGAVRQQGADCR